MKGPYLGVKMYFKSWSHRYKNGFAEKFSMGGMMV